MRDLTHGSNRQYLSLISKVHAFILVLACSLTKNLHPWLLNWNNSTIGQWVIRHSGIPGLANDCQQSRVFQRQRLARTSSQGTSCDVLR